MTLTSRPDRNDSSSPMLVDLVESLIGRGDERREGRRRQRNLTMAVNRSDENEPAPDLDIRRFLRKIASVHSILPTSNATRQRASGHTSLSLINSRCSNLIDTVNQPSAESHPAEGHNESRATTPARGRSGHLFFCSRSGISQAAES